MYGWNWLGRPKKAKPLIVLFLWACAGDVSDSASQPWWPLDTGPRSTWAPLVINEFVTRNRTGIQDGTGAYPDWIELYNPTDERVFLEGWSLTDDWGERQRHVLQKISIPARDWLVLFADADTNQGVLHLGFSLEQSGEEIGLYDPDGGVVDELSYDFFEEDTSMARTVDGGPEWENRLQPTPGHSNQPNPDGR